MEKLHKFDEIFLFGNFTFLFEKCFSYKIHLICDAKCICLQRGICTCSPGYHVHCQLSILHNIDNLRNLIYVLHCFGSINLFHGSIALHDLHSLHRRNSSQKVGGDGDVGCGHCLWLKKGILIILRYEEISDITRFLIFWGWLMMVH